MKILSLDTSMAACSVAVIDTKGALPVAEAFQAMDRGHAEALAPMVAEVMQASGLAFRDLDRITVTVGPGTFTGVRIGLSFARGTGLACGIPVIGIDSLSAISANTGAGGPLLVVADARNEEVYAASFGAESRIIDGPCITTLARAAESVPPDTRVIGTAKHAVITASGRRDLSASSGGDLPVAAHFARLAASLPPGDMPAPLYLRAPDAKPQPIPLRKAGAIVIEELSIAAAPLLATLHADAFASGWSVSSFGELMGMPGAATRLALVHGEPAAFLLTRRAADEAEIITIATRPEAQRRGIARQLLALTLTELAGQGVRHVFLEVGASNAAGLALYRGMGFAEVGRRKGYYKQRHGAEDAIVMRRELAP
jgi:tRNA threonylcarbamoyladenosine biosynthesis protein TsaB